MRIGINPEKSNTELLLHVHHRVIVPVYVPQLSGYFSDLYDIVKISLESLCQTLPSESRVTIVNNNSCGEIESLIDSISRSFSVVDRVIHNRTNRGKVEAMLGAARGSFEEFITITDCDILFFNGWLESTFEVFKKFPKAGAVGVLRMPHDVYRNTFATLLDNIFSFSLRSGKIIPESEMSEIYESIGKKDTEIFYNSLKQNQYYVQKDDVVALVGCNHACATYRREIFYFNLQHKVPSAFNKKFKSDAKFLDLPTETLGYWRLSLAGRFGLHLGNKLSEGIKPDPVRKGWTTRCAPAAYPFKRSILRFLSYRFRYYLIVLLRMIRVFKVNQPLSLGYKLWGMRCW